MAGISNEVLYGKNADYTAVNNQDVQESNGLFSDGQMWIGSTATNAGGTHINVGTVASTTLAVGYSTPDLTLEVTGRIPTQPCLSAWMNVTQANATGDGTGSAVLFDSTFVDQTGSYNAATGKFTCPVSGNYLVTFQISFRNVTVANVSGNVTLILAGSPIQTTFFNPFNMMDPAGVTAVSQSAILPVVAGSTFQVVVNIAGGTKTIDISGLGVNGGETFMGITRVN